MVTIAIRNFHHSLLILIVRSIWEFRAEGTGYPDSEVYHRINHFPWPDHQPPPFALIPIIMASMRDWLKGSDSEPGRVVVVHCKAGKGRSGTIACSYLISQENWAVEDAMNRFTERRMRSGFGAGISIPSQRRWIRYVDFWAKHGKVYVDREIEILEIYVWGLRDGVRIAVEGYVEGGKRMKTFHTFSRHERIVMDAPASPSHESSPTSKNEDNKDPLSPEQRALTSSSTASSYRSADGGARAAIYRPAEPLIVPNSDINIDVERRNKATYGFTMVTSVAHVWFNAFFESQLSTPASSPAPDTSNPTQGSESADGTLEIPSSGAFSIDWDAMDGIKGSAKKGTRAFDHISVVWRAVVDDPGSGSGLTKIITQPETGERIPDTGAADWRAAHSISPSVLHHKNLGLRVETPTSGSVSKASSIKSADAGSQKVSEVDSDVDEGVKSHGLDDSGEDANIGKASTSPHASSATASEGGVVVPSVEISEPDTGREKNQTLEKEDIQPADHVETTNTEASGSDLASSGLVDGTQKMDLEDKKEA